jgi:hypothetical protein
VSGWRRCETCRKVLSGDAFEGEATVCSACVAGPPPRKRAAPQKVTRTTTAPRAPKPEPGPRAPLMGAVGSGDLEVRERRALRAAAQQLAELHPEDFAQLLAAARSAEGLRTQSS